MSTDRYGRLIVDNGDSTYTTEGITVGAPTLTAAIEALNGMAPPDWVEPVRNEPLPPAGALATLLAVVEVLTVLDAANAVGLTPADLVAEAQAWAAASHPKETP